MKILENIKNSLKIFKNASIAAEQSDESYLIILIYSELFLEI